MKRKITRGMDIYSQRSIQEAVYERFQTICELDEDRYSEIMGRLESFLEPVDEEYYILYFDKYGYPIFIMFD